MGDTTTMRRVVDEVQRVVDNIEPEQLDDETPCAEWDVRGLLNHITGGGEMFAVCVDEGSISDDRLGALLTGDNLGNDYRNAFKTAAGRALTAFERPGADETIVKLPFGEMPAGVAMQLAVFDLTVHAWDLAKATGQSTALDPQVLGAALEVGRLMIAPEMREGGMFGAEVRVAADAPLQDQLAGFAGRQP
jgi:uncharacterized protein (TIGR03086 family)